MTEFRNGAHQSAATTPTPGAASFEITRAECLDLLRSEPVGRICVLEQGFPTAFPVNYKIVVDDGDLRIVVRTAPDTVIGRHRGNASLEVDRIALESGRAWSVIAQGQLRQLLGPIGAIDPEPWLKTGRSRWLVLDVVAVSGRRFLVRRDVGEFTVEWQVEPLRTKPGEPWSRAD
jgi:hypothetical protein